MPELPEVETVLLGLVRQLQNFTIARVEVCRASSIASPAEPSLFCQGLEGCVVQDWRRRGKYLLASLIRGTETGHWVVHLRMTGQFLWLEQPTSPCPHTRVRMWGQGGQELRFVDVRSFGQMWWIPPGIPVDQVVPGLARLGPEPFSEDFDAGYLAQRLHRSQRAIKTALLDQTLVAGVGNIYADESLFNAGIRPQAVAGKLSLEQLGRLHDALVTVLRVSIGAGGTTFSDFRDLSGRNGNYGGMAWVYRRGGHPCRRCGTPIHREKLAGRSSHWCPQCQS